MKKGSPGDRVYRETEPEPFGDPDDCSTCGGSGGGPDIPLRCTACGGSGRAPHARDRKKEARDARRLDDLQTDRLLDDR